MSSAPASALDDDQGVDRVPLHTRHVMLQGYRRTDGLYDIEGRLRDTKSYDRAPHGVFIKAGEPVHEMLLRITVVDRIKSVTISLINVSLRGPVKQATG